MSFVEIPVEGSVKRYYSYDFGKEISGPTPNSSPRDVSGIKQIVETNLVKIGQRAENGDVKTLKIDASLLSDDQFTSGNFGTIKYKIENGSELQEGTLIIPALLKPHFLNSKMVIRV